MSRASHSDELVTQINHTDINCEFFTRWYSVKFIDPDYVERRLRTLIQGIGDYLMRVVGSVPIDLKITVWIHDAGTSVYPRLTSQVGPLYYEGQGQAMSEAEEAG